MKGIDISEHQHKDFNMLAYQHDFVIIRAGYGLTEDPLFKTYMEQASRLSIPVGVYWYSYALNIDQAKREAEKMLEVIKGYKISVGVWIDMEDADKYKRDRGALTPYVCTSVCKAFCDTITAAGYHAGIYASMSWFSPKSFITDTFGYDKWIARWYDGTDSKAAEMQGICSIWQYRGAPLDLNVCFVPLSWFGGSDTQEKRYTIDELAVMCINGVFGNGNARKQAIENLGYSYSQVQQRVNEMLRNKPAEPETDIKSLALAVIRGEYGNGLTRRLKLGGKYDAVQAEVNRIMSKGM